MKNNLVSIVITTKNEEHNIEKLIKSCINQTYKNIEIIVIDNNSIDKTKEISAKYTSNVYNKGPERSTQRNFGVGVAKGEYVIILDADMTLDPKVIEECMEIVIKNSNIKGVIIPEKSFGEGFWAKCKALERNCYIGDDTIEAARFFRTETYLEVGGFDEKMISGEDWDLTRRVKDKGWEIGRTISFINHNEGKLNLLKLLKKKYYYATMSGPYIKDNVTDFKQIILFIFRPAYFRNWKLLIKDPIHTLGFLIMKTMEFAAGGIAIILRRINKS